MRNLKKILAMALTVLMVVGSFAMTATAAFDDVTDYQEAIDVMYELGIAKGISDTEFAPDESVTREQMALWIAKIMTGKVDETYVATNFMGTVENLTAFADLEEENYVGAINYAANNGIIVGTSATTFEATEAIKIQDVFAMVVRMLGYGSTAMNNNYPWSFIDKAISLGLDADLPADYSNEAEATRGETMQILFNALTALKSDGSTLGYDFFGLEKATVVITGTSEGNAYRTSEKVSKTVDGVDYVEFSILNANGTVATDSTYYALKTAFGIDAAADADLYVGDSFVVRTVDNFASFLTIEAIEPVVVNQDSIVGDSTDKDPARKYVGIDGVDYKLVSEYSTFVDGTKTTNDAEIIFNTAGTRVEHYDAASYVMDEFLNILGEDGEILLHWKSTQGSGNTYANLNGMYLFELADGTFIQPNDYIWSLAKKATFDVTSAQGFKAITNSHTDIYDWGAYSDTVLYDDDADGDWDRAIYFQYKFDKIVDSSDGKKLAFGGISDAIADVAIYDADGNALTYADVDNQYVLYHYNKLFKTLIVKEIFEIQTGLVTGIDLVNKELTLNAFGANIISGIVTGETYKLGNARLSGGDFASICARVKNDYLTNIYGKNVNFVEKDGVILAVINAVDDAKHMVYVNNQPGYTTMGYDNILAYYNPAASAIAATQAVVTVNTISDYWYAGYVNTNVAGVAKTFTNGDLLAATKDANGNYGVSLAAPNYVYADDNDQTVDADKVITITNGIIFSTDFEDFGTWQINANTVFIVKNSANNDLYDYETMTGVPTSGAQILVHEGGKVYYETSASGQENFVYIYNGEFNKAMQPADGTINPWGGINANNTIIYVTADTAATMVANNAYQYGMGMNLGATYTYTNAFDIINGKQADNIFTDYNFNAMLEVGNFYEVKNGYVVAKIDPKDYATKGIKTGILMSVDADGKADVDSNLNKKLDGVTYIDADKNAATLFGYDLIKNVNELEIIEGEYSYIGTQRSLVNNVLPKLYWNEKVNNMYKFVDVLQNYTKTTTDGKAAKVIYDAVNNAYVLNDDKTALVDNTGIVVYYYEGANANTVSPAFIAKYNASTVTVEQDITESTTTKTDKNYKVQFRMYNVSQADINNRYAFYTTDAKGISEKITVAWAGDGMAKSDTQNVALAKTYYKTVDGAQVGSLITDATGMAKTFAVVVDNTIDNAFDVEVTWRKTSSADALDSSEIISTTKKVNNSKNSTIYYFTIDNTMLVNDVDNTISNDIFVNVLFTAKAN